MLLIVFSSIVVGLGLGSTVDKTRTDPGMLAIFFGPPLVGVILAIVASTYRQKGRLASISHKMGEHGYSFDLDPSPESKAEFFAPFFHLTGWSGLRDGAVNVKWIGTSPDGVRLFEHEFITGSGKTTQVHTQTIVAFPSDYPADHGLCVFRAGWAKTRQLKSWAPEVDVGEPSFDKNWSVKGSQDLAFRFLRSDVREALADSPKGESWHLGYGWICCSYNAPMNGNGIQRFVARADAIVRSL